jgi:predicted MFS family arabinose efflux permease
VLFLAGLAAMALSPWYSSAFVLLLIGGLGTAAFSNMQTTLILTEAPPATRSRVTGIVTMCIGTGAGWCGDDRRLIQPNRISGGDSYYG